MRINCSHTYTGLNVQRPSVIMWVAIFLCCHFSSGWAWIASGANNDSQRRVPSATTLPAGGADGAMDPVAFSDPYLHSIRPLSRHELAEWYKRDTPDEASEIQFARFEDRLAWQTWLSFRAPPDACRRFAVELLENWNQTYPRLRVPTDLHPIDKEAQKQFLLIRDGDPTTRVTSGSFRSTSTKAPISWFVPEEIGRGLQGGGTRGGRTI